LGDLIEEDLDRDLRPDREGLATVSATASPDRDGSPQSGAENPERGDTRAPRRLPSSPPVRSAILVGLAGDDRRLVDEASGSARR
jgi:hypothetical protein